VMTLIGQGLPKSPELPNVPRLKSKTSVWGERPDAAI
jgi:hypothetical protein